MIAYTDGSCSGNPGPGGWAWIIVDNGEIIRSDSDGESDTTNNRMELLGLYNLLYYITTNKIEGKFITSLEIFTDSNYLFNSINKGWVKRWVVTKELSRPNYELWVDTYNLLNKLDITITKVKAHSGDTWNEKVDKLAVQARNHYRLIDGGL